MNNYIKQIRQTIGDIILHHYKGKTVKYALMDTSVNRALGIIIKSDKIEIEKFQRHLRRYGVDVLECIRVPFKEIKIPNSRNNSKCSATYDGHSYKIGIEIAVPKLVFNHLGEPTQHYYYLILRKVEMIDVN